MDLPAYVRLEPPRDAAAARAAITVVIPAYNEAERIRGYLERIERYFSGRSESHEVLVADDGSRDRTAEIIRERMADWGRLGLLSYERNRGKGHAVRMGMRAARGAQRLFADADGSTPIEELERLRAHMAGGDCDVAVGSRALSSPEVQRKIKPHRWLMGQGFRMLRQMLLNVDVLDSQCGFKLFTAQAAETLFGAARVDGFAFDVEILYLARRAGMKVAEAPVNWQDSASSRVNLLTDPAKMLLDMLRVRRLHRMTRFVPAEREG